MVRAWAADITPLMEAGCYSYYYRMLPAFRKKKADAYLSAEKKAQSAGAWILWEKIRACCPIPENCVYNLSHSGSFVMCAVGWGREDLKVGCDLEKTGEYRERIAERFFCREEYEAICSRPGEQEKTEAFYRYWVLKESFMKATRKGMALPVDSFCILLGNPPVLIRKPAEYPEMYYYREYEIQGQPYKLAVCSTDEEIDPILNMELKL